uniref:Histone H2A C-terminal domain-containing protein n=1 Tax=Glossina palpalis gambiensis TaxID=67801 RepID=A0A1B0BVR7_9MUSC
MGLKSLINKTINRNTFLLLPKPITPRHVQLAIRGDKELDAFIKVIIGGGGVFPHLYQFLSTDKPKYCEK